MHGITIESIIPLFSITSIDYDLYPGVNIRYLAGNSALVNYNIIDLNGILSSKETRQRALGIPSTPPSTTGSNRVSNTPTQPPSTGRSIPHP